MNNTGNIVFGCVTDQKQKFLDQAVRLLASLRWFGGSLADVPFIICGVGGIPSAYAERFWRLGAELHTVERFDAHYNGPSNKLRFLEASGLDDYKVVALIDCDTLIVQDPYEYLPTSGFAGKLADVPTVTMEQFKTLFSWFGMKMPPANLHTDVAGTPTLPYFNSGVCLFAQDFFPVLRESWIRWNRELLARSDQLGFELHVMDQASLTLALIENNVPITVLPSKMNFPVHLEAHRYPPNYQAIDPVIIHYHWLAEEGGGITKLPFPAAWQRARAFNERLAGEKLLPVEVV